MEEEERKTLLENAQNSLNLNYLLEERVRKKWGKKKTLIELVLWRKFKSHDYKIRHKIICTLAK